MPHVVSLAYKPATLERRPEDHFARQLLERATLLVGHGIEGDTKRRSDSRQLNIMLAETVAELQAEGFHTAPGELGESIVLAGVSVDAAIAGTHLRIGTTAIVELVYPRVPCSRFARIQGQPKDAVRGRLGFMARVLVGGIVTVGDAVEVAEQSTQPPDDATSSVSTA